MQTNTIQLQPLPPDLVTAYARGGVVRLRDGSLPARSKLLTVGQAPSAGWKATPGTVESLLRLRDLCRERGGHLPPLLDVWRSYQVQADARAKYERWVRAGKPKVGSTDFNARNMKADYVAKPGASNHNWGGAIDFDVDHLEFPGTGRGTDEALATFWDLCAEVALSVPSGGGFTPIILHPNIEQSEAWHFDRFGPLVEVYDRFRSAKDRTWGKAAYAHTARCGCLLAGEIAAEGTRGLWAYIQARVNLVQAGNGGAWAGIPDGVPGRMTIGALHELAKNEELKALASVNKRTAPGVVVAILDKAGFAERELGAL